MKQVVIENLVINSPFDEPKRHFKFTDEGITSEIVGKRRSTTTAGSGAGSLSRFPTRGMRGIRFSLVRVRDESHF